MSDDTTPQGAAAMSPASAGSAGFERLRICPVPDDDFAGPLVFGLCVVPVLLGLSLLAAMAVGNMIWYGRLTPPAHGAQADEAGQAWNGNP